MEHRGLALPYQLFVFKQKLAPYESVKLRAAVMKLIPKNSILYHNHLNDGFVYGYPLIQYKSLNGQAAILYLGEGVNYIGDLFKDMSQTAQLPSGDRIDLSIQKIRAKIYHLQLLDRPRHYRLTHWIPLQDENYRLYKSLHTDEARLAFLKKILVGNILSFAQGVRWKVEGAIEIPRFEIKRQYWISYKKVKMLGFDIDFAANVFLPPYIGLGKGAAKNYGVISKGHSRYTAATLLTEQPNEQS